MLKPGARAPDFALPDQDGNLVRLTDLLGKVPVVLYFYPKDGTWVCTREACLFRDAHAQFAAHGAVVIGISADGATMHQRFRAAHQLPFRLLSDAHDVAFRAFGLKRALGLKERATFVLDAEGVVRAAISHRLGAARHVREALAGVEAQRFTRS